MSWLVPLLRKRIQIGQPTQTANTDGGFDFGFNTLLTVWAGFKPLTPGQYIRGEQIGEGITGEFAIRRIAVASLGRDFAKGFGGGFDSIEDLVPLKSDYYIFLQQGSTVKGRLFRIKNVKDNDERGEYLRVQTEEIEERGTGFPA